ncbi:hypothetical protein ABZ787_11805, partial [Micrococcus luteus]|uniref:hypothetical protein n=1 Tax=Micrococcus luteus TaxID=1270 RepID=UPI0033E74420
GSHAAQAVKIWGALRRMNQIGAFWNSSLHLDKGRTVTSVHVKVPGAPWRMNQIGRFGTLRCISTAFLKSSLHLDTSLRRDLPPQP